MEQLSTNQCSTGVPGLDQILRGGIPCERLYLLDGIPGSGKTTLALQFLLEGVRLGESCLYITLSETKGELDIVAQSHGWSLNGISIIELSQINSELEEASHNTLFQPAEVELTNLSKLLFTEFDRIHPTRMVLDSLSELRLLAQSPLRYRRQILAFKQRFARSSCTVLLLDDRGATGQDEQVQSIVHGMISLKLVPLKFGINRRYLSVNKLRGSNFHEGNHDYVIKRGGVEIFPRLIASDYSVSKPGVCYSSGNAAFDALCGGGLDGGTGNLFVGPAGSGKSTIASMLAHTAATKGHKVLFYAFDESTHILVNRTRAIGIDFEPYIRNGLIKIVQVDPAKVAPGELAAQIVAAVSQEQIQMVVLDSLNGYVNAMPQDDYMHLHLHELLSYLNQQGVITLMILAQHGLIGSMGSPIDVSYLADTVILMRFFEAHGAVKKAVSVIKKRSGSHEQTIREVTIGASGVSIGLPLVHFEGVLTGVPRFLGGNKSPG